jgi:hypothetical protein
MKKLCVLFLCLVAVAGLWAGTVHPPGAPALEMTGYGFYEVAVTPATVLVAETPFWEFPGQILTVPDIMASGLSQTGFVITVDNLVLPDVSVVDVGYPLRL